MKRARTNKAALFTLDKSVMALIVSGISIVVAIFSATFSYWQARNSDTQLQFDAQAKRPYMTIRPLFAADKDFVGFEMYEHNESSFPARVVYSDIAAAIDNTIFKEHFFSAKPDFVFKDKPAGSYPPTIPKRYVPKLLTGESQLAVAGCVVYEQTSGTDTRRWLVESLNVFQPGSSLGEQHYVAERVISASVPDCDAKTVFKDFRVKGRDWVWDVPGWVAP